MTTQNQLPFILSERIEFGRMQWTRKWRVFAGQFTQPQLMKLASAITGEQALHSSQIHGFSTGKLRDPAPKVLFVIGLLNMAIARSNGCPHAGEGPTLPQIHSMWWKGKKWLTDENGKPMDSYAVFGAVTGQIDLNTDGDINIHPDDQSAVSKSLGKFLRVKLMEQGSDFMDPAETDRLVSVCPIVESLIYGKELDATQIIHNISSIADVCQVTTDELVDFAIKPITHRG